MEGTSGHVAPISPVADEGAKKLNDSPAEKLGSENGQRSNPAPGLPPKKVQKANSRTKPSELAPRDKVEINLKSLLQAGVHFGHQTSRWDPRMSPYIYAVRNGIHIISLPKTIECWAEARKAVFDLVASGGSLLFVGTKPQAQDPITTEAIRCGAYYVSRRWLGGMITNFQTIRKSIERMKKLETMLASEEDRKKYTKKELLMMDREREKLEFSLGGIRNMPEPPKMLFVVDTRREDIAVKEAKKLDIPVVALVDSNCNPNSAEFPIPSNDDAARAIRLFAGAVADAVIEGKKVAAERAMIAKDKRETPSSGKGRGKRKKASESAESAEVTSSTSADESKSNEEVVPPEGATEDVATAEKAEK